MRLAVAAKYLKGVQDAGWKRMEADAHDVGATPGFNGATAPENEVQNREIAAFLQAVTR